MAEEKALLDGLPPMPWYVEEIRPGHDDLARVYDGRHFGVAKPTPDDPVYRRPIAEFIVRAAETIQTIKAQLAAKDEEIKAAMDFAERCREIRHGSPNAFYAHVDAFCKRVLAQRHQETK